MKVPGHFVYVFVASAGIGHLAYYLPAMPNPMASHFGFGGDAGGWTTPSAFFIGSGVVFTLITIIFVFAPLLFRHSPDSWIHTPQREYWLAQENRDSFWKIVISRMVWVGSITFVFVSLILHLVFLANLDPDRKINEFAVWATVAIYLLLIIISVIALFRRLSKGV